MNSYVIPTASGPVEVEVTGTAPYQSRGAEYRGWAIHTFWGSAAPYTEWVRVTPPASPTPLALRTFLVEKAVAAGLDRAMIFFEGVRWAASPDAEPVAVAIALIEAVFPPYLVDWDL